MIEGFITLYWNEDNYQQDIKFLHNLKGILYKNQRPSRYTITTTYKESYSFQSLERAKIDEWLEQIPKAIRKILP